MWAYVAVYAVAACLAAAAGFKSRSSLWVAGFLLYMAAEAPLRASGLPLAVDRFIVVGWDAAFLIAIAGVVHRRRAVALTAALWLVVTAEAMLVMDPVAWLTAWHVASMAIALWLLMRHGGAADAASVGVLATFVAIDVMLLAVRISGTWETLRFSSSLSPAMAIVLYAWRMIPVRE